MNQGNRAAALMCQLQQACFVVDDLKLYLDTHPDDPEALACYRRSKAARDRAVAEYVANVGPLYAEQVACDQQWTWTQAPWPWEGE